jgi:hypothetical protein
MNIKARWGWVAVAMLLTAIATWVYLRIDGSDGDAPHSFKLALGAASEAQAPDLSSPDEEAPASIAKESARPSSSSARLLGEMYQAKDLRVYIEHLKATKPPGYGLVMAEALAFCMGHAVSSGPSGFAAPRERELSLSGDGKDAEKVRALASIRAKCASFSEAELDITHLRLELSAARAHDPVLRASEAIRHVQGDGVDKGTLVHIANAAAALEAPQLYRALLQLMSVRQNGEQVTWIDGAENGGLTRLQLVLAWDLASCEMAGTCDLQGLLLQYDCQLSEASEACAATDREQYWAAARTQELDEKKFSAVVASIRSAMQERAWGRFLR